MSAPANAAPQPSNSQPQPAQLREAACAQAHALVAQLELPEGSALLATGSLARKEMTQKSDIDLILLIDPAQREQVPEDFWYPIWNSGWRLDCAIRTPHECVEMMASDVPAALAQLEMQHIAGDEQLAAQTRSAVLQRWRRELPRRFDEVADSAIARWRRSGSVVAMTHPDLKHGRGGLRDVELLRALALGNVCDAPPLDSEHRLLLDARTLLHHAARRRRDVLDPEFAFDVAVQMGFADRYELARALADAARSIDDALTGGLNQARRVLTRKPSRRAIRKPLDMDVVDSGGEVTLSRNPRMDDAGLILRVAAASSRTGLPVAEATWSRLQQVPALPTPWPKAAASDFFAILAGRPQEVIRAMDRHGLWTRFVPQWDHIRGAMPRERSHIHTIDQHTLETVARCAQATVHVSRPDLLLLGALYHDIGKNQRRPHEQVGAALVAQQAAIMGLNRRDISCVQTLVAEHTTLSKIASTMDPASSAARDLLLSAVHYDPLTLELLEQLTAADAQATGPTVWTHRLSRSVFELCSAARTTLSTFTPRQPIVSAPTPLGIRGNRVHWQGKYARESVRVLAVLAAKEINIEAARMIGDEHGWRAEFDTRGLGGFNNTTHGQHGSVHGAHGAHGAYNAHSAFGASSTKSPDDYELEFIQAYKSGVFSMLPELNHGEAIAGVATVWHGNILEVRTPDRRGALGTVIGVLPEFRWLTMSNPGATMIVQCHLLDGFDRARVERDITRALVGWES